MTNPYWVGLLPKVGTIVYDPSIQSDDSDTVKLFDVERGRVTEFDRPASRGKIKRLTDSAAIKRATLAYEAWKVQSPQLPKPQPAVGLGLPQHPAGAESQEPARDRLIEAMQDLLKSREAEVGRLGGELTTLGRVLKKKEEELAILNSEAATLRDLASKVESVETLEKLARQAAFYASGGHRSFRSLILALKLDVSLPIHVAAQLETRLRVHFRDLDPSINLSGLIRQAQEAGVLDDDAVDMAHIVRKQRNALVHSTSTRADSTARILLALYAAAILWPKLPS